MMRVTDLLNLIWGQAYLKMDSETTGHISSDIDLEYYGNLFDREILKGFKEKDGILAQIFKDGNSVSVMIHPDYFQVNNDEFIDHNFVYDKIDSLFHQSRLRNIIKIEVDEMTLSNVS